MPQRHEDSKHSDPDENSPKAAGARKARLLWCRSVHRNEAAERLAVSHSPPNLGRAATKLVMINVELM